MSKNYDNRTFVTQQTILAVLFIVVAFFGGCWFMAYRAVSQAPATEVITITLPETNSRPAEVMEVIQEKPERKYLSALLHPFGFMILLLAIIAAGGGLILLIVYIDRPDHE